MTELTGVLIRLAGCFEVERNGVPYRRGVIGGKARTLLKLLAAERGGVVPADRVVEALWGDCGGPKRPVENVATLVSRLRGVLGAEAVLGGRRGYKLGVPPVVRVDLDEAAGLVREAEGRLVAGEASPVVVAAAGRALELLRGGVVLEEEADSAWVAVAREEAAELVRRARHVAAAAGLRGADPAGARRMAEAAVRADLFDEAAHRLLMRAHAAAGDPAKALLAYERLRRGLATELGTNPSAETRALHVAILREEEEEEEEEPEFGKGVRTVRKVPMVRTSRPAATSGLVEDGLVEDLVGAAGLVGRGRGEAGLVGRDGEVAEIAQGWAEAVAGRTKVLMVVGEAGAGKSRLAAEAVRVAVSQGGIVLRSRCHGIERGLFLQPFVDALNSRPTHVAGEGTPALEALVRGERVGRRRAFEAVCGFLRVLAGREPVLLVLDDLHAAGTETVGLVHYLARRLSGVRLLVVVTVCGGDERGVRVAEALRGTAGVLRVGPLPFEAVKELAMAAGQDRLADEVFEQTRGHPQLVVALLDALAGGDDGLPERLRAVVLERVRRAGGRVDRVLRAASVLGRDAFDPFMLGAVLGLAPQVVARQCERALDGGLLMVADGEGSAYEFADGLTRDVLRATTPAPTRHVYQ
jgi:DNA-binding SARP family transcriptional activator